MLKKLISALLALTLVVGLQANPNEKSQKNCTQNVRVAEVMKTMLQLKYNMSFAENIRSFLWNYKKQLNSNGIATIKQEPIINMRNDFCLETRATFKFNNNPRAIHGSIMSNCNCPTNFEETFALSNNVFDGCDEGTHIDDSGNKVTIKKPGIMDMLKNTPGDSFTQKLSLYLGSKVSADIRRIIIENSDGEITKIICAQEPNNRFPYNHPRMQEMRNCWTCAEEKYLRKES